MRDPVKVHDEWEMLDPWLHEPPRGQTLLLINEGGVLSKGPWYDGALAWAPLPRIPATVKARLGLSPQQLQEERERLHGGTKLQAQQTG